MSRDLKQEKFGKAKYKVGFLGCLNCSWLYGLQLTDQALRDLVYGDQNSVVSELPRLSIAVDKKELKITQTILSNGGKKKVPLKGVSTKDVLFVAQGSSKDLEGMVGCIYYGYNSTPNGWPLTVHGYLLDSVKTANLFVRHLNQYINTPKHRDLMLRREKELVHSGCLAPVLPHGQGSPPAQPPREDGCHVDGAELRRGLRRTPFPGTNANSMATSGDRRSSLPYCIENDDQHLTDSSAGPCRLPRTLLLPGACDESFHQGTAEPFRHSLVPSRAPSSVSHQLPRIQPLDYRDLGFQRQGSQSPDYIDSNYASTGGLPRDFSPTISPDVDYRISVEWSTNRNSIVPRPCAATCLAAELKSKLGHGPILLPPKDYDTLNRTRGSMVGIETRKCLNPYIVGSVSANEDVENTSL